MNTNSLKESSQLAETRSNIYKFLSYIFLVEPSKELVAKTLDEEFRNTFSQLVGNSGGLESMIRFKENFRGNEDDYETLIQEYYNLFKIPGGKYVPPYESVYTDKKGLIMGPSTVATKKFYARAGVEVSNEYKDLPDHIGLEQRFVSHLCDKELKCWIKGDAKGAMTLLALQREFLNDHLMKWISEFRKKVEESTKNDFYKGITRLTEDLIKIDFEMISETLKHFQSL